MPVGYWHCWLSSTADCFALVQSSQAQQPNRICVMSYDSHLFPSPQSCHGSSHAGWTFANMAASDAFCRIMNFSEKHLFGVQSFTKQASCLSKFGCFLSKPNISTDWACCGRFSGEIHGPEDVMTDPYCYVKGIYWSASGLFSANSVVLPLTIPENIFSCLWCIFGFLMGTVTLSEFAATLVRLNAGIRGKCFQAWVPDRQRDR